MASYVAWDDRIKFQLLNAIFELLPQRGPSRELVSVSPAIGLVQGLKRGEHGTWSTSSRLSAASMRSREVISVRSSDIGPPPVVEEKDEQFVKPGESHNSALAFRMSAGQ